MVNFQSSNFDQFQGGFVGDTSSAATRATRDYRNTHSTAPVMHYNNKTGRMEPVPGITEHTFTIHNVSGGLNRIWGVAREASPYYPYSDLDRVSASSLDTYNLGVVSLPLQSLGDSAALVDANSVRALSSTNIFGTCVWAAGSAANKCLQVETSTTDPTASNRTYTPGSAITSLTPIIIGGVSSALRLAVGMESTAVNILSDLASTPTSAGSMHANTTACWGILQSPLNSTTPGAGTLLIYANQNIYSLGCENAIGTAPTSQLSNVPNGGYAVGIVRLSGVPLRAYWVFPLQDIAGGHHMLADNGIQGTNPGGFLVSTNLEGTDVQTVKLPIYRIFFAAQWGNSIVVSDGYRVLLIGDNEQVTDLHWLSQRTPNSNIQHEVMGFLIANENLFVWSVANDATNITATAALEAYDATTGNWHQVTKDITMTNGVATVIGNLLPRHVWNQLPTGSLPFSAQTGFCHIPIVATGTPYSYRKFVPPLGYAPFYTHNQTVGAGGTTGMISESSGAATSAAMLIEGAEGKPFVLSEVRFLGDLRLGNTSALGATWTLDIATQQQGSLAFSNNLQAVFNDSGHMGSYVKPFDDNRAWATRIQWKMTIGQGSNTYQTANGVPFQFKLLVFDNFDDVRSPSEVRAAVG